MTMQWTYELDLDNDRVMVYNSNGNQLNNSPHTLTSEDNSFPADLTPCIAAELQEEINSAKQNNNKYILTDRAVKLIQVLSNIELHLDRV